MGIKKTEREIMEETAIKFEADNGDGFHMNIFIVNGKIVRTDAWSLSSFYEKYEESPYFTLCYENAIRFITMYKPAELKNIYHALSDETMKAYCRKVQQKLIEQLQF